MIVDQSLRGLATQFAAIGRTFTGPDALTHVTRAALTLVEGTEYASISQGHLTGRRFATVAPTDDRATRGDAVQYALGTGPCVDAIVHDVIYRTGDLAHDDRWPQLGPRLSQETGARSMLAFRLFFETDENLIAALNLYSNEPDAFDDAAEIIGTLLATHASLALAATTAWTRNENLNKALLSNREIGVAMGILMASDRVTREQAFNLLRIASQNYNRKLVDIAGEVADTGVLQLPTRKPPRPKPTADPKPVVGE